jgi:hypothetical protein
MNRVFMDNILHRLRRKSLSNQIAVAVGCSSSDSRYSIPTLSEEIIRAFKLNVKVKWDVEYFRVWNEIIEKAEKAVGREQVKSFVSEKVGNVSPNPIHHKIASLPISNFIDATFDRSLHKALVAQGKTPILHDWDTQMMGSWKQSDYKNPNVFFIFPSMGTTNPWFGLYHLTSKWDQNKIQLTNICEMLNAKDLILLNFSYFEAEYALVLSSLVTCCEKIVNCVPTLETLDYWAICGVSLIDIPCEKLLDKLLPAVGKEGYSFFDMFVPRRLMVETTRKKQYDSFISYFRGDEPFADMLYQQLNIRGLYIWKDTVEIEVGDSFTDKIQEGLRDAYSFTIILSPEALARPWVREELRAAHAQRLAGELKILPVLYKDCQIPPFLADYKYADFREGRRHNEQLELLERSIRNAVLIAREKI